MTVGTPPTEYAELILSYGSRQFGILSKVSRGMLVKVVRCVVGLTVATISVSVLPVSLRPRSPVSVPSSRIEIGFFSFNTFETLRAFLILTFLYVVVIVFSAVCSML